MTTKKEFFIEWNRLNDMKNEDFGNIESLNKLALQIENVTGETPYAIENDLYFEVAHIKVLNYLLKM